MTLVRMRVMKTCARRVTRDRAIRRACPHLSISAHNSPARQRGRPILFAAAYCLHRQTSTTTSRSLMSHSATLMGGPPSTADSDYVNEWLPRERTTDRLLCRTWRNVLTKCENGGAERRGCWVCEKSSDWALSSTLIELLRPVRRNDLASNCVWKC